MSRMDGTTAKALLQAASCAANHDTVADIYKAFKSDPDGPPSKEQREWVEANIGRRVHSRFNKTNQGTIVKLNEADCGLYAGGKFPVLVRLDDHPNELMEFMIDQLTLIP